MKLLQTTPEASAALIDADDAPAVIKGSETIDAAGVALLSARRDSDVEQQVPLRERMDTGDDYNYHTVPNLDLSTRSMVEFSVMANNDAHVLLTLEGGSVFEIVIGGWNNTYSTIRRAKQGPGLVGYAGAVDSAAEYRRFVLDWSTAGVLKLYAKPLGSAVTLLMETPKQPEPVLDIKSMAVATGWGSTGKWEVLVDCAPVLIG